MVCYNVCPNCGQYMYEIRCRAICPRCHLFFDCEDLFHFDEVVSREGKHMIIKVQGDIMYNVPQAEA